MGLESIASHPPIKTVIGLSVGWHVAVDTIGTAKCGPAGERNGSHRSAA